jgi:ABC-type Fe3+/spermidine/putrescine transport system ATPase subunit
VTFSFAARPAVDQVSLTVTRGCFFALLGPSGCGKTTLLRLLGGYLAPQKGTIHLDGEDVTRWSPERRNVGMVFQNYALFPHLSARANVAFGLEMRRLSRRERYQRTEEMLERVGLALDERGRYPHQLSGGQQQRVALARALVIEPRLLLLDEPLANLDRHLREQLRGSLRDLQRRTGVTTLLVTHDQEEALALADQVGVMTAGRLLQVGPPRELYRRPLCPFVARFLGEANLFEVERVEGELVYLRGGWRLTWPPEKGALRAGAHLLARPEDCVLFPDPDARWAWPGTVAGATFLGPDQVVQINLTEQSSLRVRCPTTGTWPIGARVTVGIAEEALWVLPENEP